MCVVYRAGSMFLEITRFLKQVNRANLETVLRKDGVNIPSEVSEHVEEMSELQDNTDTSPLTEFVKVEMTFDDMSEYAVEENADVNLTLAEYVKVELSVDDEHNSGSKETSVKMEKSECKENNLCAGQLCKDMLGATESEQINTGNILKGIAHAESSVDLQDKEEIGNLQTSVDTCTSSATTTHKHESGSRETDKHTIEYTRVSTRHTNRQCDELCYGGTMSASMCNKTFMSPEFLTRFLEAYRELPVLWQVRSTEYSNRGKRDEAWDLLVQFTREKIHDADLNFVKKKVDSIRASFRKELRRVRESKRRGASGDDVYKPTLWYFDLLLFTADQENPRKSKSSLDEDAEDVDCDSQETTALTIAEDEAREGEITQMLHEGKQTLDMVSQSPFLKRKKTSSKTSRSVHAEETQRQTLIQKAMAIFNQQDDEYDALGKTYAAKLRRMPATQRDIADKLINDVLFKGLQSNLTPSTFISDYGYTTGAWRSSDTPSPFSTYSNPTPSATPGPSNYPVHSPEQDPGTVFPP
ncbi:uncharacterized protein LOC111872416 isoform X3 [Cryptotermes secundus]|uniref:uncharacterized protein LOC111872416 isoform X3 n=1 Tax=Cryptotermes secundus TaxID=105785 RepID=UPI000CD7AB91|nr:uncharacterized protein LOC111872416 isoform X3 [Cryptotermes secundus]